MVEAETAAGVKLVGVKAEEEAIRRMAYAEAEKTRAEGLAKADAMRAQGYTYAQETQREVGVAIASNEGAGAGGGIGSTMSGVVQAGIGIGAAVSVGKATVGMMNVGGLVGYNNGFILNSYANVNVTATSTDLKCYAAGLVGYNNGSIIGSFAYGNVSAKGYAETYSCPSGLVALEGNNSNVTNCYRYNGQTITKFGNSSTSYNNVGGSASLEYIITYCKANWNGSVWSYNKALPSF